MPEDRGATLTGDFDFEQYWHEQKDNDPTHRRIAWESWMCARLAESINSVKREANLMLRIKELEYQLEGKNKV